MKSKPLLSLFLLALLGVVACDQTSKDPILIEDAWVREAPPNATAMAGYMRISNTTDEHIILHAASSPAFKAIEFHRSVETEGVYKMIPHLHLHIAANSAFELKPGDYHLMLFNPVDPLKDGDEVTLTLTFSGEQQIDAIVPVKKAQY